MLIAQSLASVEAASAGPSYSVPRLCAALAALGHEVDLFTIGDSGRAAAGPYRDRRFPADLPGAAGRLGLSLGLRRGLRAAEAEVFHTHGLWMLPGVHTAGAARRRRRPLLLSPRGMLGPAALAVSPGRKRLFWRLLQGPSLRGVACLHATAKAEYEEIRAFGLRAPVAVVPNGIDLPAARPKGGPGRLVLSLGRVHPKKGLDRLVHAWSRLEPEFPDWRLAIVGPSEGGHAEALTAMIGGLGLRAATVRGEVLGEAKLRLLAEAELFVLPTLNENFAMTVAESLASGTPVIATRGAPWEGLEVNRCGWWIEHGADALSASLATAMRLAPEERRAMGARGRAWMERDFRWDAVAKRMDAVYQWLIRGVEPPDWVRLR